MSTVNLTKESFQAAVTGDGIVLVDWWADWCAPCKSFAPVFERASENHPEITFAKVDTEAEERLAAIAGISSIPTLMVFRDGVMVFSEPGALSAAALETVITAVQELDMDDVRAKLDAAE
ncbi:thioredoxin family protein [Actinoplanes sp. NPDC049596]|uniref:thioredoxin family protein n=1 Tax=unclassified Actinoplanes TaxID=2626549 RepID=UPI0034485E7A